MQRPALAASTLFLLLSLSVGTGCTDEIATEPLVPEGNLAPSDVSAGARLGPEFEPMGSELGVHGFARRVRHSATGTVLLLIPAGEFTMGAPSTEQGRDRDERQHPVKILTTFYLGETEVTIGQWKQVMGALPMTAASEDDDQPASGISWHNATKFIARLNEGGGGGWRLPTEAEWEYACRAGTVTPFSSGEAITPSLANYGGGAPGRDGGGGSRRGQPVAVRSFPPNPWGLYDMHGNVWEWCQDLYLVDPERDRLPTKTEGASRTMRGGGFPSRPEQLRSAYRDGYPPSSSGLKYGFRLARTIGPS